MNPFQDYGDFEMFTLDGNIAVANALDEIFRLSFDRTKVWNQTTLEAVAMPIIDELAKTHEEVYDTEPRGHIGDFLNRICDANGWTYDRWDSRFW